MKAKGFINEEEFVNMFHDTNLMDLPFNAQLFIESIYPNIKCNDRIVAHLADGKYKTDFYLKIKDSTFRISLKMGYKNSVHVENVYDFTNLLRSLGISDSLKELYLLYHFGDSTKNGKGYKRLNSSECKDIYRKSLPILNKELNKKENIINLVNHSTLGIKHIHYLIYGTPTDFIWISKDEILDLATSQEYSETKLAPYFSVFTIQTMNRCLNYNQRYNKLRYFVQIKWYNIFDDILIYRYLNNKDMLY